MAEARATVEFENDDVDSEEKEVKTDINPQEITDNPEKYARQVATEKANQYDQMAGFSVPRDYVMLSLIHI